MYEKAEANFCRSAGSMGTNMPHRVAWSHIERMRTEYQWRPVRDVDANVCLDLLQIVCHKAKRQLCEHFMKFNIVAYCSRTIIDSLGD